MGVKTQYQILSQLKGVDEKIVRLQTEMERIPLELQRLEETLSGHRSLYNQTKEQTDTAEKKVRQLESDLREKEESLRKAESKMMEVKTNQEYQAAVKENEGQKQEKGKMEEQLITLLNGVEQERQKAKDAESEFKAKESAINERKGELETERSKLSRLYEEQIQKRNAIASQLDKEVAALYSRVSGRVKGTSIVVIENGMCLGCNMKIRPQLYNEVLGFKTVHRCPSCGRLLIASIPDAEVGQDVSD